jgi:hypothetical protein
MGDQNLIHESRCGRVRRKNRGVNPRNTVVIVHVTNETDDNVSKSIAQGVSPFSKGVFESISTVIFLPCFRIFCRFWQQLHVEGSTTKVNVTSQKVMAAPSRCAKKVPEITASQLGSEAQSTESAHSWRTKKKTQ